jgi:hypothetical protein
MLFRGQETSGRVYSRDGVRMGISGLRKLDSRRRLEDYVAQMGNRMGRRHQRDVYLHGSGEISGEAVTANGFRFLTAQGV